MKYRHKVSRGASRRMFTHGARKVHKKNMIHSAPMRGGIRL